MKWLKKWCYFILLMGCGIIYLSCVDHWQVYAESLQKVRSWYHELENGDLFAGGRTEQTWLSVDGSVSGSSGRGGNAGSGNGGGNMPGGAAGNGGAENGSDRSSWEGNTERNPVDVSGDRDTGSPSGDMSGSGNTESVPGDMSGSENTESVPGDMGGSGNTGSVPGDMSGSGNTGSVPGDMSGSGNTGNVPEDMSGSGNTGNVPGDMSGSGNTDSVPGDMSGSGNTGSYPEGTTGSGNTGNHPGGGTGSGNTGTASGAPGGDSAENILPEPQYVTVEDDYFADALFIGDSRTVGMFEYGGLEEIATFYASKGLTVYKLFDADIVSVPGERKPITVEEALQQNSFSRIYLMIGINEMGTGTVESFLEKYQEVVAHLQELQPDAVIYLQAIIKVTAERSAQGDYINNEGIVARNEGIAELADNQKIFFLDVNPEICDESGGMIPEYTFDGVHLKAKYIEIWKEYLKTHAISS